MRSSILITSLICSYCWISDSQTVRVKPGEDVTMSCSNISSSPSQADWFRVVNGTQSRCIAGMFEYNGSVSYCKGLGKEKFEMSSNISTVFLKIKQVDLSDSGLYICGFYIKRNTVIATAATLKVHDAKVDSTSDEQNTNTDGAYDRLNYVTMTADGLTVFIMLVVLGSVVRIGRHSDTKKDVREGHKRTTEKTQCFVEKQVETSVFYAPSEENCCSLNTKE